MKEINIKAEENAVRIDAYLSKQDLELSRVALQRLIEEEKILVNGKKIKQSYKVSKGDDIKIIIEEPKETKIKAEKIPLEIIYEDNDMIVINKEKGIVVHPANGNLDGTLVNALMDICKDSLSGIGGEIRPRNST